ncbi:MAG: globin domain-containing protein [Oscillospiraceae bacterium]
MKPKRRVIMLSQQEKEIIKSTSQTLKQHGEDITKLFYQNMFKNDPEIKMLFDMDNQKSGEQPIKLAAALLTVSQNIDNLSSIMSAIDKISQVHVDAKIKPEHYPIVGKNLILTIQEFLDIDNNNEIIFAWSKAYTVLSQLFIEKESQLYKG